MREALREEVSKNLSAVSMDLNITMKQGDNQQDNDTIESNSKSNIATLDSCFDLVGSRQYSVACSK